MEMWKDTMIAGIHKTWEDEYKIETTQEEDEEAKRRAKRPDFLDKYLKRALVPVEGDVFNAYITAPAVGSSEDDTSLLAWWDRPDNPYKPLKQQAFDLLSIPAMSAEVERVFSSAKRLLPPDRNRLSDDTIELLQLLKHWWKHGIVSPSIAQNRVSTGAI
jgi:hAT family C-terminal dimerisation region